MLGSRLYLDVFAQYSSGAPIGHSLTHLSSNHTLLGCWPALAAFFYALLHLPVELAAQGVNEDADMTHQHAFASASQILGHSLSLSFTNTVPLGEINISPPTHAELSQATSTSEFADLGGTPDNLVDLLDHGFLNIHQPDEAESDMDPAPAPIVAFLSTSIRADRYNKLRGATTTAHFHSLGGNQYELISAATAADECSWLHSLASTMPLLFGTNSEDPTHASTCPLLIDNTAALSVSNHPKTTAKSKHLRLREFRIRDYAGENHVQSVRCLWTPTRFNVADFFTKLLGTVDFPRLARFLVNAPFNPIADAASSHIGAHHLSHLPTEYHSSSRQASVLTDENVVVSLFHLDIVTPLPYVPGVSSAQGGEEESTPALQSTPALIIVSGD